MREVTVRRDTLLDKVKTNREIHLTEYKEVLLAYRDKALDALQAKEDEFRSIFVSARDGVTPTGDESGCLKLKAPSLRFLDLETPQCHVSDYDRVIAMLEMSEDELITLTSAEFSNLVQNRWAWTDSFEAAKMSYGRGR